MKKSLVAKVTALACVLACCIALAGCFSNNSSATLEAQQANNAYMSKVNELMAKLNGDLDLFNAAVSRGDVVNMRTQANSAYKSIDELTKLEAPTDYADVKAGYVEGTNKLREALDAYINLYTETAKTNGITDDAAYTAQIQAIQKTYDEGIAALEKADNIAATGSSGASQPSQSASGDAGDAAAQQSASTTATSSASEPASNIAAPAASSEASAQAA